MDKENMVTRESQVGSEISALERSVEELHTVIEMLDNRLSSIKRGDTPADKSTDIKDRLEPSLVPHAQKIYDIKGRVVVAIRKVSNILDKVEI